MKAACCTSTRPSPSVERARSSGKSARRLQFRSALGIQTGDLVTAVYPSRFASVQYPVYPDGRRRSPVSAWRCKPCRTDFNAHNLQTPAPAFCRCGRPATHVMLMPPRVRGFSQEGSYVMSLG